MIPAAVIDGDHSTVRFAPIAIKRPPVAGDVLSRRRAGSPVLDEHVHTDRLGLSRGENKIERCLTVWTVNRDSETLFLGDCTDIGGVPCERGPAARTRQRTGLVKGSHWSHSSRMTSRLCAVNPAGMKLMGRTVMWDL